jgi:hypothetical protein
MLRSVPEKTNKASFLSENIIWLGCLFGRTLSPVIPQGETKPDLYWRIIGYMARESNNQRTPVDDAQCGRTVSYIYVDTSLQQCVSNDDYDTGTIIAKYCSISRYNWNTTIFRNVE